MNGTLEDWHACRALGTSASETGTACRGRNTCRAIQDCRALVDGTYILRRSAGDPPKFPAP
eukprot:scaffold1903_cov396-Prasinococcus_capsulatus_cf.AAC.31